MNQPLVMAFVNDDVEEFWHPIRRKFGTRLNKCLELAFDSLKNKKNIIVNLISF